MELDKHSCSKQDLSLNPTWLTCRGTNAHVYTIRNTADHYRFVLRPVQWLRDTPWIGVLRFLSLKISLEICYNTMSIPDVIYVVTVFWLFGCHIILHHIVQLFREWLHSRNSELPSPCANLFFKSLTWLSVELYSSANKILRGWILGDTINVSSGFPLSSFCNAFHFRIKCSWIYFVLM